MLERINDWKDAPVWNPATIDQATAAWFQYLGEGQK
jgi:UDP-glucose 4-epimerase